MVKDKPIMIVDWKHSKEFIRKVVENADAIIKEIEKDFDDEKENKLE